MKKASCLLWLAVYALLAFGIAFAVERRVGRQPVLIVISCVAAAICIGGLSHLTKFASKIGELWVIRKGMSGDEPVEGKRYAAIGPISPIGGTRLLSPLTHTPAVAYSYAIFHRVSTYSQRWNGVAMIPCAIRAGVHSIRLLTFPELGFTTEPLSGESVARHAEEYLRKTEFPSQMSRDDGTVKNDLGPPGKPQSMNGMRFVEYVMKPGDVVCAIGTYSAARGALLSPRLERAEPARLFLSRLNAVGSHLMNGAIMIALVAAALTLLYAAVPLNVQKPSWMEIRFEDLLDEKVRTPIYRAELFSTVPRIEVGETFSSGEARGRIRTARGEANVTRAAMRGNQIVFYDDAREVAVLTVNSAGELRGLKLLGEEIPPPPGFTFRRVSDNEVVGRISFMKQDAPAVHVIFRAILNPS